MKLKEKETFLILFLWIEWERAKESSCDVVPTLETVKTQWCEDRRVNKEMHRILNLFFFVLKSKANCKSSKNRVKMWTFKQFCFSPHINAMMFCCRTEEEKGSPPQPSSSTAEPAHFVVSSLPLSHLACLVCVSSDCSAAHKIYSVFSMNMYVRTNTRRTFYFFGFNRLAFRLCLCVQCCQFLAVSKIIFLLWFCFPFFCYLSFSLTHLARCDEVFFGANDEYLILTCRFFLRQTL
jgi:hypothetical protein